MTTAFERGLFSCHACGLVSKPARSAVEVNCPRCASRVHFRKPHSLERSWAFLIAAYILYIPANLLPMMETSSISGIRKDTIMSGILALWDSDSWGIAVIIFMASIAIPLLKMIALTLLLISVQRRSVWRPDQRTRLYRLVELVGRWSMLDIYVVALLTTLLQFRLIALVKVGPAAFPFGAVVVLTVLAVIYFDPRLIWDSSQKERNVND